MEFRLLKRRERWAASGFSLALGFSLAAGFLALAREIGNAIVNSAPTLPQPLEGSGFPILAAVFYYTLPHRRRRHPLSPIGALWITGGAAFTVSLLYGAIMPGGLLVGEELSRRVTAMAVPWYVFAAPLGEELLFRGWLYEIADWLWPEKFFTATNPLPTAVWVTGLAFSTWHLQNLAVDSAGVVAWQLLYTLFTGLWLGWLRWRSGSLWLPLTMHVLINLASVLF